MPTLLAFVSLLSGKSSDNVKKSHPSLARSATPVPQEDNATGQGEYFKKKPLEVHGVRLVELTERGSTVMKVSEVDEYSLFDPVLNAFRVLGQMYNLAVSGEVTISPVSSYPDVLVNKATDEASDLLLLPWSETGGLTETQTISSDSVKDKFSNDAYTQFVASTLATSTCNTAVFINKGFSGTLRNHPSTLSRSASRVSLRRHSEYQTLPALDRSHHIFLPFLGGADGRAAVRLVLQLAENPEVTATIVHLTSSTPSSSSGGEGSIQNVTVTAGSKEVTNPEYSPESDAAFFSTMRNSLPSDLADRVLFDSASVSSVLEASLERAKTEVSQNPKNGGDIIVLGRGNVSESNSSGTGPACLGVAAEKVLGASLRASVLVILARGSE